MKKILIPAGLILVLSAIAFAADSNSSTAPRESYNDHYGVLTDKNIFVRDRSKLRSRRDETSSTTRVSKPVEESLVLTGIVLEDEGFRAYVEDMIGHGSLRLGPGDSVAHGKVAAIGMDSMDYEHNGQRISVTIGSDLTGHAVSLGSSSESSSSSSAEASTQPSGAPIDPNDPNLTAEQKMKLRRQQELKK